MELGRIPIQILLSVGLLIFAVIAAVAVDLMRRKNENLREAFVDLQARHVETVRREQLLLAAPAAAVPPPPAAPVAPAPKASAGAPAKKAPRERARLLSSGAQAAIERGMQMASTGKPSSRYTQAFKAASKKESSAGVPIAQAVKLQIVPAISNGGSLTEPHNLTPVERRAPYRSLKLANKMKKTEQPNKIAQIVRRNMTKNRLTKSTKDWSALLSKLPSSASHQPVHSIPAGFQDGMVLSRLLNSNQRLNGLAVSIGVSGEATAQVRAMVKSFLGPQDFGCQTALDEFLLIYPNETGAAAQRKLNSIAQEMWNFQLQNLEQASVLFSWGGVEAHDEPIENAVTGANERMQETRRGRSNLVTMKPRHQAAPLQFAQAV